MKLPTTFAAGRQLSHVLRIAAVAAGLALGGCQRQSQPGAAAQGAIRLGLAGPFTGSGAAYGLMMRQGATMAVEEANADGGVAGQRFELVFEDDAGKNDQAKTVAKKLADDPSICAVIGHFNSTCSLAGRPTYQRRGVVQFTPGSTNVDVCRGSEWTFRNLYHDQYQGEVIAQYIRDALGARKAAVFYDNDDYGKGLKSAFTAHAAKIGLQIVGEEAYVREKTLDFSTALDKFHAAAPDIVFVSGLYNEAGTIVKQARSKGIATPFIGGDGVFSPGLIEIAGQAAEGTYVVTPFLFDAGGDAARTFAGRFAARFGTDPDAWAALGYDAAAMLIDTIRQVGRDRRAIRDHLAGITTPEKGFHGITGITFFDEYGDCAKPAHVAIVRAGRFVAAPQQIPRP